MRKINEISDETLLARLKPISKKELIKTLVGIENTSELYILSQKETAQNLPFVVNDLTNKDRIDDFISHIEETDTLQFTFLNRNEFEDLTHPSE